MHSIWSLNENFCFKRGAKADFDETIDKMLAAARRFDPGRVRAEQVARAAGPAEETGSS